MRSALIVLKSLFLSTSTVIVNLTIHEKGPIVNGKASPRPSFPPDPPPNSLRELSSGGPPPPPPCLPRRQPPRNPHRYFLPYYS